MDALRPAQHVFVVDNARGLFGFYAPDEVKTESPAMKMVSAVHPVTQKAHRFWLGGGVLQEIQRSQSTTPTSWFVDQQVHKDGALYVSTPCDPLFLLLPALEAASKNMSPLSTILSGSSCPSLRAIVRECLTPPDALAALCDTSDRMGPDMPMFRLNSEKVVQWLTRKMEAVSVVLADVEREHLARKQEEVAVSKAFVPSSVAAAGAGGGAAAPTGASPGAALPVVSPKDFRVAALQIIAEYVAPNWIKAVCEASGLRVEDVTATASKPKPKPALPPAASPVDFGSAPDQLGTARYTQGHKRNADELGGDSLKPKTARTLSMQHKKLEKVNKRGMKTMMAFFGKK